MCDECFKCICPDNCPESDEYSAEFGFPELHCHSCASPLYSGEEYLLAGGKCYCLECVREFDIEDILEICGSDDICELLVDFGFQLEKI